MELDNLPHFVKRIEGNNAFIPESYANLIIGNKKNLHRMIFNLGFFIPNIRDRSLTTEWLLKVMTNQIFSFKKSQINKNPGAKIKISKIDLMENIQRIIGAERTLGNIIKNKFFINSM